MTEIPTARPVHTALSLDLGTNCGWAVGANGVIMHSGVKSFYTKDAHPGIRFMKFNNWLLKFKGVTEIFFEDVRSPFMSSDSARVYCGMLCVLQMFCAGNGIKMTGIKPTAVKKEFVGSGRAKKVDVCTAAIKLGWANGKADTDANHDEADACAIYYAVMKKRGNDVTFRGSDYSIENAKILTAQIDLGVGEGVSTLPLPTALETPPNASLYYSD